uniref:Transmembrane protein 176B n=1 Tax=Rousettus aegyptiacus TaxID=9407 RepID=A0A7J8D8U3_ROUAE|nr:transmembrane protein 176B [Rousettus aegyptiacus]
MAQSTVTVNGADMASVQSPATHVHIHIHQESALAQLKGLCAGLRSAGPPKAGMPYGRLALGAIAAGAGAIAHEKRRGTLSGWVSGLLTLAGIATALAALVLCVNDIRWRWFGYMDTDRLCDRSPSATTSEYGWGPGWRQQGSYGHPSWLENECREYLEMLTNLFLGVRVLLLTTCALLTIVSLASLGLGLRSLCRHGIQALAEDESTKKLLGENSVPPSPCKEKTKATIVV